MLDLGDFNGDAILSARIGERYHLFKTPPDEGDFYAVMLLETPNFPGVKHEESKSLTVLAAAKYPTSEGESGSEPRWGWVHLDADTKIMIGQALEALDTVPGQWYYLLITGGIGHCLEEHVQRLHDLHSK